MQFFFQEDVSWFFFAHSYVCILRCFMFFFRFDARTTRKNGICLAKESFNKSLLQLRNKQEASSGITEYGSLDAKDDTDHTD